MPQRYQYPNATYDDYILAGGKSGLGYEYQEEAPPTAPAAPIPAPAEPSTAVPQFETYEDYILAGGKSGLGFEFGQQAPVETKVSVLENLYPDLVQPALDEGVEARQVPDTTWEAIRQYAQEDWNGFLTDLSQRNYTDADIQYLFSGLGLNAADVSQIVQRFADYRLSKAQEMNEDEIFQAVFPDLDKEQVVAEAEDDFQAFIYAIWQKGRTPATEALLMSLGYTIDDIHKLWPTTGQGPGEPAGELPLQPQKGLRPDEGSTWWEKMLNSLTATSEDYAATKNTMDVAAADQGKIPSDLRTFKEMVTLNFMPRTLATIASLTPSSADPEFPTQITEEDLKQMGKLSLQAVTPGGELRSEYEKKPIIEQILREAPWQIIQSYALTKGHEGLQALSRKVIEKTLNSSVNFWGRRLMQSGMNEKEAFQTVNDYLLTRKDDISKIVQKNLAARFAAGQTVEMALALASEDTARDIGLMMLTKFTLTNTAVPGQSKSLVEIMQGVTGQLKGVPSNLPAIKIGDTITSVSFPNFKGVITGETVIGKNPAWQVKQDNGQTASILKEDTKAISIPKAVQQPTVTPPATPALIEAQKQTPQPVVSPKVPETKKVTVPPPPKQPPMAEQLSASGYTADDIAQVRKFWIEDAKKNLNQMEAVKSRLIDVIQKDIPAEGQGRFLTAVKNVKTGQQLLRAIDFAQRIAGEYDVKRLNRSIVKEIAHTTVKGGKGKFTADIQSNLDVMRKALRASPGVRQNMIFDNSGKALAGTISVQEAQARNYLIRFMDLKDKDVYALADVLNQIKQFKATGRLERLVETQMARRERIGYGTTEEAILDLTARIKASMPVRQEKVITGERNIPEKVWNVIDSYITRNQRAERILTEIDDNHPNGKVSSVFYKPMVKSLNAELKEVNDFNDSFQSFVKEQKIDIKKVFSARKHDIAGLKLTSEQKIGIFLHSLNPQNTYHLINGNKFTQEQIDAVARSLTPDERKIAEWIGKWMDEDGKRLGEVYELLKGVPFKKVDRYFPIRILYGEIGSGINLSNKLDDEKLMRQQTYPVSAGLEKGFTQSRVQKAGQPISIDAFSILLEHVQDTAHYRAYLPLISDLQQILKSPQIHDAIISKKGINTYSVLNKWLADTAASDPMGITSKMESYARTIRVNTTASMLAMNIATALRQPVSFLAGATESGVTPAVSGIFSYTTNPKRTSALMKQYSPAAYNRTMEREVAEVRAMRNAGSSLMGKMNAREMLMFMSEFTDKVAVSSLWQGAFDNYLSKHPTDLQGAADYATSIIRHTQGWSYTQDLPEVTRSGEFMRALTTFTNEINNNWNYYKTDVLGKAGAGEMSKVKLLETILLGLIAPALIYGLIGRGRVQKTPREVTEDITMQILQMLPIFGPIIVAGYEGYRYGGPVATETLSKLQDIAYNAQKQKWDKVMQALGEGAGELSGLPVNQTKKFIQGIQAWQSGESVDIRDFIFGKYSADQIRKEDIPGRMNDAIKLLGTKDLKAQQDKLANAKTENERQSILDADWTYQTNDLASDLRTIIGDRTLEDLKADSAISKLAINFKEYDDERKIYEDIYNIDPGKEAELKADYLTKNPDFQLQRLFWGADKTASDVELGKLVDLAKKWGIPQDAIPAIRSVPKEILDLVLKNRKLNEEYAFSTNKEAFLTSHPDYSMDLHRIEAIKKEFTGNLVNEYAGYYSKELSGYEDDWYLQEHPDFYREMVTRGIWQERDFSKVPTKEVNALYENYLTLAEGTARTQYRLAHPELDAWLVLAKGYKPAETSKPTPTPIPKPPTPTPTPKPSSKPRATTSTNQALLDRIKALQNR